MPLSENEQRLLEQMERALYAEDPKFATVLRGADPRRRSRRRIAVASLAFAVGVVLLMTGLLITNIPVGILGFVVMLASAYVAVVSYRKASGPADLTVVSGTAGTSGRRRARAPRGGSGGKGFMNRIEDRWNKRRDERDI